MKTIFELKPLMLAIVAAVFITACNNDDDATPIPQPDQMMPDIAETAIATADLSILVDALTAADLVDAVKADGPLTVFAPTNEAFTTFLSDNGFAALGDVPVDVLKQVLLNHVVAGKVLSTDLATGYVSSSSTAGVDGKNLSLYVDLSNGVQINGANVTAADNLASNGVVHIVDKVIGLPNVVDHALLNSGLTSLVGALTANDNMTFTGLLSDADAKFTVLAPVNEAFAAFTNEAENDINNVLSNHVIKGAALASTELSNSYANTLAKNADGDFLSIYVNTDDGVTLNGTSTVAIADIVATNGIIHAVTQVIDLPTVVTFAVADAANFSSLVGALTAEGQPDFVSVLSTPNGTTPAPFTVFAPLNSAFEALEAVPSGDALTAVLNHHVIAGANVVSGDLSDGLVSPATLEGDALTFGVADGAVSITDGSGNEGVTIVVANVQAINGVIHAIDTVLIPNTEN